MLRIVLDPKTDMTVRFLILSIGTKKIGDYQAIRDDYKILPSCRVVTLVVAAGPPPTLV